MSDPSDDDEVSKKGFGSSPEPGRRKDGKPFREGNTRADGSYATGKYRAPEEHRFRKGDGRKRGKRPKGGKNFASIWAKKLKEKMEIGGKNQSAAEWLVEGTIRRGITKSDRAAETAMNKGEELDNERQRRLNKTDDEIIDAWLAQRLGEKPGEISDDHDLAEGAIPLAEDEESPHEDS